MSRYHDRLLALRKAKHESVNSGTEHYICPWGDCFAVLDLYEMCNEGLHPEFTVFPDGTFLR
jgi:hypothetical protein